MTKLLPLVIYPDKRLETASAEVDSVTSEIQENLKEMELAMFEYGGIGLAAVQVGIMKKLIVINHDEIVTRENEPKRPLLNKTLFMVNAKVLELGKEKTTLSEGCLSLPSIEADVERPSYVKAEYIDEHGEKKIIEAEGLLGKCIQHEIDHTNGKIILQYVKSSLKKDMLIKKLIKYKTAHTDCSCPSHKHSE